jgi:endonuclease-3
MAPLRLPRKTEAQKARARRLYRELERWYPEAHCELDYRSPHELLIATILSAQALDASVNKATPALFAAFPAPADYAAATPQKIEPYVRSLGFFRNKARAVHEAMRTVAGTYSGRVPDTMEDLLTLRGVARKTANVVLGNAYGVNEGVVVDTHVIRLSRRLGLSRHADPRKIELDLMALFPRESWTKLAHMLIWHGRRVCKARGGSCAEHPLCREFCSNARAGAGRPVSSTAQGARAGRRSPTRARRAAAAAGSRAAAARGSPAAGPRGARAATRASARAARR